jgi:hypothetical protein
MELKHLRMAAFYLLHVLYFPLLVVCLRMLHHLRIAADPWTVHWMPPWFFPMLSCTIAGGLYIGLGYTVDLVMRKKFGFVGQESDASWHAGYRSRTGSF